MLDCDVAKHNDTEQTFTQQWPCFIAESEMF